MRNKKKKNTFLSFKIGKETFAVSVQKVLEVLQKQYITEVPNVPDFVEGVINFRGKIIPVIDTRVKFSLPKRNEDEKYVVIVFDVYVEEKKMLIGAMADSVHNVTGLEENSLLKVPELGYNYDAGFLLGMIKNQSSFTMVLDIDKVFSKNDIDMLDAELIARHKETEGIES